ncbi:hypothetical protein [Facilibium subflavum]|uniref:hypothetical protein n=1 Tax=Facilibium subflavum TaxID=2219058 RepID=UPI000E6544F3|nr:hypothetical protein [Facilibium subflavum]
MNDNQIPLLSEEQQSHQNIIIDELLPSNDIISLFQQIYATSSPSIKDMIQKIIKDYDTYQNGDRTRISGHNLSLFNLLEKVDKNAFLSKEKYHTDLIKKYASGENNYYKSVLFISALIGATTGYTFGINIKLLIDASQEAESIAAYTCAAAATALFTLFNYAGWREAFQQLRLLQLQKSFEGRMPKVKPLIFATLSAILGGIADTFLVLSSKDQLINRGISVTSGIFAGIATMGPIMVETFDLAIKAQKTSLRNLSSQTALLAAFAFFVSFCFELPTTYQAMISKDKPGTANQLIKWGLIPMNIPGLLLFSNATYETLKGFSHPLTAARSLTQNIKDYWENNKMNLMNIMLSFICAITTSACLLATAEQLSADFGQAFTTITEIFAFIAGTIVWGSGCVKLFPYKEKEQEFTSKNDISNNKIFFQNQSNENNETKSVTLPPQKDNLAFFNQHQQSFERSHSCEW